MTITSFIARSTIAVAGSALLVAAAVAPAMAATHPVAQNAGDGHQDYRLVKGKDGKDRYCTTMPPVTGSFIPQTICKTAKEWAGLGVQLNVKKDG